MDIRNIIIIILFIIASIAIIHLIVIKKELKRIAKKVNTVKNNNSNNLINSQVSLKEVNQLISEINILLKETKKVKSSYEAKTTQLKKMITNISHDLRTPLTSAYGYVEMILTSDLSEEEKQSELHIIKERLTRLEELLNSFFEFSKLTSGDKTIELEEINLNSILEECIIHYYEDYKKLDREIILDSKISKIKILSNKEMLTRVFDNLIGNSYKHSNSNLNIKVEEKDKIEITFSNKLENQNLDINHIFDEFYTVDISRTKKNTGLGLAIAKEFIENLEGTIQAKKKKDNLEIIINLPNNLTKS